MSQIRRRGLTTEQKTELWDRWQRGESLKAIGLLKVLFNRLREASRRLAEIDPSGAD